MKTDDEGPELGSGALREALAKRAEELHIRMNYSGLPDDKPYSECPHFTFERCTSKACSEARALLSLSSSIEHEPHSADFLRGYNEGCKDGAENTLREIIARNTERKAQASSEVREALTKVKAIVMVHREGDKADYHAIIHELDALERMSRGAGGSTKS